MEWNHHDQINDQKFYLAEITEIVNIALCCPSGSHLRPTFTTPLFDLHQFDLWHKTSGAGRVDIFRNTEIKRTFFSQGEHLGLKVQQSSSECLEPEILNHIHNIDTSGIKIIIIKNHLHFFSSRISFLLFSSSSACLKIQYSSSIVKTSVPGLNPWNHESRVLDI